MNFDDANMNFKTFKLNTEILFRKEELNWTKEWENYNISVDVFVEYVCVSWTWKNTKKYLRKKTTLDLRAMLKVILLEI